MKKFSYKNMIMKSTALALTLGLSMTAPAFGYVRDPEVEDRVLAALTDGSADLEETIDAMMELGDDSFEDAEEDTDPKEEEKEEKTASTSSWDGPVLSAWAGTVMGPSGKETYYNLDMSVIVEIMRGMGNTDEYWVREDGCKMLGQYIMCAANLDVHPRGSLVESSLGTCIVCDTGGFAYENPYQLDIATTW